MKIHIQAILLEENKRGGLGDYKKAGWYQYDGFCLEKRVAMGNKLQKFLDGQVTFQKILHK